MSVKLQKGMYVKVLKECVSYDVNSFDILGVLEVGTQCKIDVVAALVLFTEIVVAVIIVHNDNRYVYTFTSLDQVSSALEVL